MSLNVSVRSALVSMMSAIAIVGFSVPMALAEPITFTLINNTNRVLEQFYASPPSTSSWEEDILGVDVLNPGEATEVTIDDGRQDCQYDIKGVFGPGPGVGRGELIQSAVNICNGSTYTYSN